MFIVYSMIVLSKNILHFTTTTISINSLTGGLVIDRIIYLLKIIITLKVGVIIVLYAHT